MKSKDEILDSETMAMGLKAKFQISRPAILKAMDEYAKEVALEFANYAFGKWMNNQDAPLNGIVVTVEEALFDIFKNEKNKQ
jgi:hypothetical protein